MIRLIGQMAAAGDVLAAAIFCIAALAYLAFSAPLIIIDVKEHRLPAPIVRCWAAVALVALCSGFWAGGMPERILGVLLGGVAYGVVYLVIHLANPQGMGFGDVRLAPVLGFYLGALSWAHVFYGLLSPMLCALVIGVVLLLLRTRRMTEHFAFGPYMILGVLAVLVFG
ncbi:prepilin peptidase [Glutamicibacter sp. NPDC090743]|uniref:prepilin peptidase n=1 Tax=Glutamicibacter sp. NPDC090743 TaxID=3364001 RepID=UPI0038261684